MATVGGSKVVVARLSTSTPGGRGAMTNFVHRLIAAVSVTCAVGAAALLAPGVSTAQANAAAGTAPVTLDACSASATSQPFAPWLDFASYELVPGGDFESSTWALAGGAGRVPGSEPYAATGTLGSFALSLPPGSSARSPLTCVDTGSPSMRFFIAGSGSVAVSLVAGNTVIPAGIATAGGSWTPTPMTPTNAVVLDAASGGTATQVSVTFSGVSGSPRIDDVFIDPWFKG